MTYTFVSLTIRKVARGKIVEGHSTKPVHQERSTYPPGGHCGNLGAYELRSIGGEGETEVGYNPILLNMQSHSTVTPFDKYAESQSRIDCFAVIYPILLNIQRHSHEATVMPHRC